MENIFGLGDDLYDPAEILDKKLRGKKNTNVEKVKRLDAWLHRLSCLCYPIFVPSFISFPHILVKLHKVVSANRTFFDFGLGKNADSLLTLVIVIVANICI